MIDHDHIERVTRNEQADPESVMPALRLLRSLLTPRPISEYHEGMGAVLWWKFPIVEAPYVGSPNDLGFTVIANLNLRSSDIAYFGESRDIRANIGGWPGYHTHFTPLPTPETP